MIWFGSFVFGHSELFGIWSLDFGIFQHNETAQRILLFSETYIKIGTSHVL
jgi:hypothetical protein